MALVLIAGFLALIQLWWALAYLYGYRQTQESVLLLQVSQGIVFGMLFLYIVGSIAMNQQASGFVAGILLIIGVVLGYFWRRRNGIHLLIDYYPNAMFDVLMFRKPQKDLTRRQRAEQSLEEAKRDTHDQEEGDKE